MSDESTAQQGGGAAVPASNTQQQPAPKSDAEAAQREAAAAAQEPTDAEKAAKAEADRQAEEKKKQGNRTRDYIQRINGENAELRRRLDAIERQQQPTQQRPANTSQQRQAGPPTLEEHNYDFAAWKRADDAYNRQQWTQEQEQAATARQQQESQARYNERADAFADANPDFFEVVGSIDPSFLTVELQAAIIGHEKGPEIAYHLANNEDALWNLASVRADLLPAAIGRLASRLGAAPPAQPGNAPAPQQQPVLQPKPISQAPAPAPTVGGRSPTDTPPEKLTDDDWYKRDVEKRRKR